MDERTLLRYTRGLKRARVVVAPGLDAAEIGDVERAYGFQFPPDLKALLMYALPVSDDFIDWRRGPPERILNRLSWPLDGICFDIAHSAFWLPEWGDKPDAIEEACAVAERAVAAAPPLIPIKGHRYIPALPHEAGNPVFSVYQKDIIIYGRDLWDYLENEFAAAFGRPGFQDNGPIKSIPFWTRLAVLNHGINPDFIQ
ncbi:MAG TPA: hypothetical protein VGE07_03365 [Herpetosiphonaceae bacterium]